jgi:C4-dicarboxylate-binding protein DctP
LKVRYVVGCLAGLGLAAAAAVAVSMPGAAPSGEPIVIKFSHVVAPDTPKGKAAEKFKELAERLTGGAVKVQVYPNSELYKDKEELEALQLGAVQMLAPSLAKFGALGVKEYEALDLPYIFPSYDALHKVTGGEVGALLFARLEDKGIKGLAYWDNGFKIMSANQALIHPADYRGLKMRIQASKVSAAEMAALGALPQAMAFSDVYQALQSGLVDGAENTPSNLYTQRMHEVQSHLTVTNHGYLGYAVIVNKAFWDQLPDDIRGQLEEAMQQATDFENRIAAKENEDALEKIRAAGTTEIHEPTEEERSEMIAALLPVHKQMAELIGQDTIDAIYQATGFQLTQ